MKKLLFLFLVQVFIISCKREEPITEHTYHYLDAKYLAISPYFNNPEIDTLEFVSNTGDTQVFVKTHVDTNWYIVKIYPTERPDQIHYHEQRRANFKCIKGKGNLHVILAEQAEGNWWETWKMMIIYWGKFEFRYDFRYWSDRENPFLTHTNFKEHSWQNKIYKNGFKLEEIYYELPILYHSEKEGIFLIQDSISNIHYTLNN